MLVQFVKAVAPSMSMRFAVFRGRQVFVCKPNFGLAAKIDELNGDNAGLKRLLLCSSL
jgi:hypothetical protein